MVETWADLRSPVIDRLRNVMTGRAEEQEVAFPSIGKQEGGGPGWAQDSFGDLRERQADIALGSFENTIASVGRWRIDNAGRADNGLTVPLSIVFQFRLAVVASYTDKDN